MLYRSILIFVILFLSLNANDALKTVKVQLQWKKQYEFAGFLIAKEKGYYKKAGLNVEFVEFEPGMDIVDEVLSGRKEFGIWNSGLIEKWLNGEDIVLLANYFKRSPLALLTKPDIKVPSDLIGKKIMVHDFDANGANYKQMFETFGINSENTQFIEPDFKISDFSKVDGISVFLTNEPYNFIKNFQSYNVIDPSNYGVEFDDENLFTSNKFSKENPKLVKDFIEASNLGWKYAVENIDETVNIIFDKYNTQNKSKEALLFEANESQKFIQSKYYELGKIYPDKLVKIAKIYIELELANKVKNLNHLIFPNNLKNTHLSIDELEFIKNNNEIVIANDTSYYPLDFNEFNEAKGYSIDLIKAILEPYGFTFKFITTNNWSNAVNGFFENKIDILTSVFKSKNFEEKAIVSKPYLKAQDIILTRNGDIDIKNANELTGKTIALPNGYSYLDILKENGIEFNHLPVKDMKEAVSAVSSGEADATIESDIVINYIINKNGYINLRKVYKLFDSNINNYSDFIFVTNKEKPILASLVEKGLENISLKKRKELSDKWFHNSNEVNMKKVKLNKEEKEFLQKHKTIKISNEIDYPPFDFTIGNEPRGYSIDLIELIAKKAGLNIEFINGYTWNELINQFKEKKIDVIHTLRQTEEREKLGTYSEPFVWFKSHFITNNNNPEIYDISQLKNKVVAVGRNWSIEKYLYKNHPEVKLLVLDSLHDILEAVSKGDAYAAVLDDLTAKYSIKKYGYYNLKISSWFKKFDNDKNTSYHLLVQDELSPLKSILNKGIRSLTIEELESLERKWFGNDYSLEEFLSLTNDEEEYLKEKNVIKMCIDPNWAPLESLENGKYTGMGAEIFDLIKKKSGLNIEVVETKTWAESMQFGKERKCDIFSMLMKTSERKSYLNFTKPYLSYPFVIATRKSEIYVDNIDKILDKKIAIGSDYAITEILKESYPNKEFIEVKNVDEGLNLLNENKVYAFIGNLVPVAYSIQKHNLIDIKISGKFDHELELSVGIRNDEPLLSSIMQKALNLVSEDEKQRIYNKWFYVKFEQSIDYSLVLNIVLFALFIFIVFIYWNNRLYKEKTKTKKALENLKSLQNELEIKNKELEKISITDKLTNTFNRHKIDDVLKYEILRSKRTGNNFGLIIIDIDFFKNVNDEFGHNIGDKFLIEASSLLKNNKRESDTIGRWGGEEFIIIVPDTTKEQLIFFAEKLRSSFQLKNFDVVGKRTCSFGLTISEDKDDVIKILERADSALYLAKRKGRNRVEFI